MSQILQPIAVVARFINLSERRVQQLVKEGILPKPTKGKYDLVSCVRAYVKYLQDRAFGKGIAPQDTHLERARLIKAQADKTELEVETLKGNLIHVDNVESDWMNLVMACRSKLLSIPSKTAFQIVSLDEAEEIEKFLKRVVSEALTELSQTDQAINEVRRDETEGDVSLDTTTRTNSKPVGRRTQKAKPRSKRRTRKVDN